MKEIGINLGLIAARGGSKGIPGKNLLKIGGKELICIAAEVGLSSPEIEHVICSTDSEQIAEVARKANVGVPFMRPSELAQDETPMLPVMQHAIQKLEEENKMRIKSITILDPTAPLRTIQDISDVINLFTEKEADLALSVHVSHQNPYFNMLQENEKGYFQLPLGQKENYGSRQAAPKVYCINTICWVYSRRAILQEKRRIPEKTVIYEFPEHRSIDIDTDEDLMRLTQVFNKLDK